MTRTELSVSRNPYVPPGALVTAPALSGAKRRWWFLVPVGYATLAFLSMLVWWWLQQPAKPDSFNFALDPGALRFYAKEALYQGGVVLVVTGFSIALLPRICLRHAVCIAVTSGVAITAAGIAAEHVLGRTTNGEQLIGIVLTYVVVLLIAGVFVRGSESRTPHISE